MRSIAPPLFAALALAACAGAPPCPAPVAAAPVSAAPGRVEGRGAPCFPEARVLFAGNVRGELDEVAPYAGEVAGPPRLYGSCRVHDGELTDAAGTLIARIHCGIDVLAPGLVDNLLNEVGVSGQRVIDEHPGAERLITCFDPGDATRCWFAREIPGEPDNLEEADTHYYVDARLPTERLEGKAALAFLAAHDVSWFQLRGYCH